MDENVPNAAVGGCPACAERTFGTAVHISDYEYRVSYIARYACCEMCGTVVQSPMPLLEELGRFYPPSYHAATTRGLLPRLRHQLRYQHLAKMLNGDGGVLDYGCGNAAFLIWVRERWPSEIFDWV